MENLLKISSKDISVQQLLDYQKAFTNFILDPGIKNRIKSLGYTRIWDEIKLYNNFVLKQLTAFYRSNYYFMILNAQAYIDAYKIRDERTLGTLSNSIKEICSFNYRQACVIDNDANCVINFPFMDEFKPTILELYPDLNGKI